MYEEKIIWHEITTRPLTEEEKAEYAEHGYADYEIPEYVFSGEMPKDGQDILIATNCGVSQDLCMIDCDECNNLFELETRGDWDGVKAWADMPKYKGGDSDEKVVHCKDCRLGDPDLTLKGSEQEVFCNYYDYPKAANGFCEKGKMRTDE